MKSKKKKLLLIEDDIIDQKAFKRLADQPEFPYYYDISGSVKEAKKSLKSNRYDVVLADYSLGDGTAFDILKDFKKTPIIVVTGTGDEEVAVQAMKLGAYDYIIKDVEGHYLKMVPATVENAIKRFQNEQELQEYHENLEKLVDKRTAELKKEIIERKQVEDTLRESERRLKESQQIAHIGQWELDLVNNQLYWSDGIYDLFDVDPVKFKASYEAFLEAIHPEDRDLVNKAYATSLKNKTPYDIIHRLLLKDGTIKYVSEICRTEYDKDGNPLRSIGTVQDITELKQAEEEQKRLISAINQAAESVVITDIEATILYVNPAFERLTGYGKEEAIGQNPRILKSGKHNDAFYRKMWDILKKGEVWRGEIINKGKDGTLFTEEATISPVFDNDGNIINYIGVRHDVTKQRILEEQLIQSQKMETVGRLAGGVAHDFNNMLSVILGYTELIIGKIDKHDPILKELKQIQKAGERSADITRQLLAFSRKQVIEPKIVNINPLIVEMEKMLGRLLGEDIDLSFNPVKGLWNIKVDQGQINQIVINLGVNARDAMPVGGKLTIETANVTIDEAYCQGQAEFVPGLFVMLAVSDNGIGMDRETKSHIFEPFFTTKDEGKGTGLGLATIYGIIKQNNGFINVYSELGHGTTFKLYFPRCVEEVRKVDTAVEVPKSLESYTILLAEDDEMVRNITRMILEMNDYTVLVAETPNEALALCENSEIDIDLLLTDVVMPQMSGQELKEAIEAIRPGIKTLFMSGYTSNVITHHSVLDKGINFIQKPFTKDGLARKVLEVIKQ